MTLIDVHHHPTLPGLIAHQERRGLPVFRGGPAWNPEIALEQMAITGTTMSVLSVPADLSWAGADLAAVTDDLNDELADIVRDSPSRFGAFATLPLPDPDLATAHAVAALDSGRFEGVAMLTSYQGAYLAQPEYTGLLQELDARDAVVFMHPILVFNAPAGLPGPLLEGTFDTTRAVTALAAANVFERFPRVRFLFPHTGGMVPYIKWRIAMHALQGGDWNVPVTPEGLEAETRKLDGLYYDTTLNLGPLLQLERTDRILFGTDVPWANDSILPLERDYATQVRDGWSAEQVAAVSSGNALRILPHAGRRLGVEVPA
ncbi:aminocarboxymuconate-semialdehyde decarboxylase [Microbacterium trichothecenolyticum]|uniref:amidohydrolase family protein n=1 Tax=Microbacterium trichothecenolyticum TaxID=69370 RepID=UPI00286552BA|nr:amidohydrolase family protein [Microbacterium trichothecenolyticum]MDR7185105.1 aminocarboxymuconate-semialdehyde decarboxylase [Microbacterium trichothecenolyticum]